LGSTGGDTECREDSQRCDGSGNGQRRPKADIEDGRRAQVPIANEDGGHHRNSEDSAQVLQRVGDS
jgi:hypothetical protein